MLVLYYFQGELGESLDRPNAFMMNGNASEITFGNFLKSFPFSQKQNLFYRFRAEDSVFDFIWRDISDLNEVVPVYRGVITVKILRNEEVAATIRKFVLRRKVDYPDESILVSKLEQRSSQPSVPKATPAATTNTSLNSPAPTANTAAKTKYTDEPIREREKHVRKPSFQSDPIDEHANPLFQNSSPSQPPAATASTTAATPNVVHFDGDIDHDFFSAPQTSSGKANPNFFEDNVPDMMSFGSNTVGGSSSKSSKTTRIPPPATSAKRPTSNITMDIDDDVSSAIHATDLPSRAELAAQKEEHISQKVQDALEFKKEMDNKNERHMQEFDEARQKHEEKLQNWAFNGKVRRNVRTLLSTAQNVLPSNSKWKPVGLGDLLEPAQIKKQYRKAMLVVHPDHCVNADSETKFICKRVFEAINEAYDEFLQKEGLSK